LLVPLAFNDGSAIPQATLLAILEELYGAFGGWTVAGEVEGAYRMQQTGQKKVEKLLQVWVAVAEAQLPLLREMVGKFGALLGQEMMYLEIAESKVEFIPPAPPGNSSHEEHS
jgi:hypothetical protein